MDNLRVLKNMVNEFASKVAGIRKAIAELLARSSRVHRVCDMRQDNDEDLAMLSLTTLWAQPMLFGSLADVEHDDAEILLETYLQVRRRACRGWLMCAGAGADRAKSESAAVADGRDGKHHGAAHGRRPQQAAHLRCGACIPPAARTHGRSWCPSHRCRSASCLPCRGTLVRAAALALLTRPGQNLRSNVNDSLAWFQGVTFGSVCILAFSCLIAEAFAQISLAILVFVVLVATLSRMGLLPRTGGAVAVEDDGEEPDHIHKD